MALSKTSRDGTRQIGGAHARAWWALEQFHVTSSVLFHFSHLTFLFVIHAHHESALEIRRHDLRSHVLLGNTTLRRRPCNGSWHPQPSMQTTRSSTRAPAFLFLPPRPGQIFCCVHKAKLTCVHMQHGKRWVWSKQWIVDVDVHDNWQIAWRFSASEVQNDHKKKACDDGGVRERDHSVYMWKLCLWALCNRPLPGCA